ncbi:TetR family transcriptional regulator [Rhodococcus sp. AD45-ID]|uniref:TetR/AcrR family transcriptional regulator n=1 Tax=Rhodococcus TaxID=1827 RepID=UPI000525BAD7|nr:MULTISPECIES: TetR/AcrR family transcriptional regulator [Rhodococcus]NMD62760.1 TetR family transcriptional regulator [Nocardia globerula]NRI67879.1 TetR family transcriptional regulator [Rhodococcus sp. MS16]MCE4266041.1 TetR family transcriptional regulator [Rhodococcus globerulus]PSR43388.1 TetR family transcriptional regulator [Rhodococcus sp. AD45-ID]QXW00882.1 TetR/AcrR family transcriptional regulator [Rhodococcus globerulus]
MITEPGLRDRKKAATRAALSSAAERLARALGIECVTADAIASEAGVSTRTFHNYFSSKEEAVLASFEESVTLWIEALASRPADEPILDVLEDLVVEIVTGSGPTASKTTSIWMLSDASPALYRDAADMHQRINRAVIQALAERTGTDVERDLYPTLLLGAVAGAAKSVIDIWSGGKSDASGPEELVHDAFRQIRAGLPAPPPRL